MLGIRFLLQNDMRSLHLKQLKDVVPKIVGDDRLDEDPCRPIRRFEYLPEGAEIRIVSVVQS